MVDSPNKGRGRSPAAILSIITGSLLLILATVTIYAHSIVFNTDRYTAIAEALIANEAVADSLANAITTRLFERFDIEKTLQERLPDRIQFLAAPMAAELESYVRNEAHRLISSDEFKTIWVQANQVLHTRFIKFLQGESEFVQLNESKVVLDLGAVGDRLRDRLTARGITIFDNVNLGYQNTEVVLFEAAGLQKLQSFIVLLDRLYLALPILVLIFFGISIAVAPHRLLAIFGIGLGIACSMILLSFALNYGQSWWLEQTQGGNLSPEAAKSIYDIVTQGLRNVTNWLFGIGLAILLIAMILERLRPRTIVLKN